MHKLLIVDDDEATRRMMKYRLSAHYEIVDTGEATQAVELALTHRPAAILMDLMMPEFSGFELCRGLRDLSYTSRIPIFVVSGESESRCKEHCARLGAVDYFQKPIDFKRLQTRLVEELQKRRPERRRSVRVQMRVSLCLRGVDSEGLEFEEFPSTENVSVDGFLCECPAALVQNSLVQVFVAAGDGKYKHAGSARVVRRQDANTPRQKYGFHFEKRTSHWVLQPA